MKKGKVKFFNTKKGFGFIQYDQDKEIYVHHTALQGSQTKYLEEGQEVFFEIKQGRKGPEADKVRLSSNEINLFQGNKKIEEEKGKPRFLEARAPYNFVPLNQQVVQYEKPTLFDRYDTEDKEDQEKRYTGYIHLEINTRTPLYIRDTFTPADMQKEKKIQEKNKRNNTKFKFINPDFFSPGGRICIPGSSIRGMIRTLVEITGFSNLSFYEKSRKYHFRSFADKSIDLREEYKQKMIGEQATGSYLKNLRAGYLIKDGIEFKIKPAQKINNRQFFRVKEKTVMDKDIIKEEMCQRAGKDKFRENNSYKMGYRKVKFKADKLEGKNKEIITGIFGENHPAKDAHEGCLILSGWMRGPRKNPRGKYLHWVIGPMSNETLEFAPGVIDDYKNDDTRHEEANLLKYFKKNPKEKVPCFYVEREGKVISFGHTGLFRLAYEKKLADLVPQNREEIDIAEAIFGNETGFPGRVFFEDAYLNSDPSVALAQETVIKILAKPKPTTFQHYLRQEKQKIKPLFNNYEGIKNYNSPNTQLRGYKLYWHKSNSPDNWEEVTISFPEKDFEKLLTGYKLNRDDFKNAVQLENNKIFVTLKELPPEPKRAILDAVGLYETQHTKIKAVKSGVTFKGRIRFENLSSVELGALLFSLELPSGCCHKLGMGKPLGLGTIQISTGLYLSDRANRYKNLFAEWHEPGETSREEITTFKNEFARYVLSALNHSTACEDCTEELWHLERMDHLKTILDFENKPGDEETGYMELAEFRNRNVLPTLKEIINRGIGAK
jgi:CRISPR-associated protein (TIGR03986 family)